MMRVFFGLGTNLGDKERNLLTALRLLQERVGEVVATSSFLASAPWGFESSHTFLNAVCAVDTSLAPEALLHATQAIEREMGRTGKSVEGVYTDRLIDIDILLYGDEEIHLPGLDIPHPLMEEREFVMNPFREVMEKLKIEN